MIATPFMHTDQHVNVAEIEKPNYMIVDLVYGTRPNIIKAAALYAKWRETRHCWPFALRLIDTGQHWDQTLSAHQCRALNLPAPAFNLHMGHRQNATGGRPPGYDPTPRMAAIANVAQAYKTVLASGTKPAATIAIGDVNGSVGVAQAANTCNVSLFHLEAGLRGGIDAKAEEANRHELDRRCHYLWAPDESAAANLLAENTPSDRITVTGNIMIDALLRFAPQHRETAHQIAPTVLVTIHRAENTDDQMRLKPIVKSILEVAQSHQVIWPLHPRTKHALDQLALTPFIEKCTTISLLPALPYPAFMARLNAASAIITDSGGILEECAFLGKPAVIVRPQTERPHAMAHCGFHHCAPADIARYLNHALPHPPTPFRPKGWDGKAAERMLQDLSARLQNMPG